MRVIPTHRFISSHMPTAVWLLGIVVCGPALATTESGAAGNTGANKSGSKIYKYLQGGTPSFSDVPPSKVDYVFYRQSCYACAVISSVDWNATQLHLSLIHI